MATTPARSGTRRQANPYGERVETSARVSYDTPRPWHPLAARAPPRTKRAGTPPVRGAAPSAPGVPFRDNGGDAACHRRRSVHGNRLRSVVALDADTERNLGEGHRRTAVNARSGVLAGTNAIPPQLYSEQATGASLLISLNAKTGAFTEGFGKGGMSICGRESARNSRGFGLPVAPPPSTSILRSPASLAGKFPSLGPAVDIRAWDLLNGAALLDLPYRSTVPGEPNHDPGKNDHGSIAPVPMPGIHYRR